MPPLKARPKTQEDEKVIVDPVELKRLTHPGRHAPIPERVRFLRRLNKEDGPIHPIHGRCWMLNRCDGKAGLSLARSSRPAYRIFRGPIPDGLQVLHKCDNPGCVNPGHLFLGTISDNIQDAVSKGRWASFPGNQHALGHKQSEEAKAAKSRKSQAYWEAKRAAGTDGIKLSQEQVAEIRRDYRRTSYLKSNSKELAERYGVSRNQINRIVAGRRRGRV